MSNIMFSIIIPIYNIENYLKKSIDSAINQSYDNIEIILVNDGSTDNSLKICKNFAEKDKRIVLIDKDNTGLSDARNTGLINAKGEYIIFLDGDDFLDLNACMLFSKIIEKHTHVEIIAANIRNSKNKKEMLTLSKENNILKGTEFLKKQLTNKTFYQSACRNIYKKSFLLIEEFYFKFGLLHEDVQWTPRVFLKAKSVKITNITHYNRVERKGSITKSKNQTKNALDLIKTVKELSDIYVSINDPELKRLLFNNLVSTYLSAFQMGKLYRKKYKKLIDKEFVNTYSLTKRNKMKARLFSFSPRMYYYLNKVSKVIR